MNIVQYRNYRKSALQSKEPPLWSDEVRPEESGFYYTICKELSSEVDITMFTIKNGEGYWSSMYPPTKWAKIKIQIKQPK